MAENTRLRNEIEAKQDEADRLRGKIRSARIYAGEHLPADAGTGIMHMLENALKEGS